jgi:Arc/MetJ-type ribon-helix-helix transcriptional regulator
MNSEETMARYAVRFMLFGDTEEMKRIAERIAAEHQHADSGNVVSIEAERTKRATRDYMRSQGY